jgi:hypothetical protein
MLFVVGELFLFVDRTVQRLPHDTIFDRKPEAQGLAADGVCDDIRTHWQ